VLERLGFSYHAETYDDPLDRVQRAPDNCVGERTGSEESGKRTLNSTLKSDPELKRGGGTSEPRFCMRNRMIPPSAISIQFLV
jgi:hypothetical protein